MAEKDKPAASPQAARTIGVRKPGTAPAVANPATPGPTREVKPSSEVSTAAGGTKGASPAQEQLQKNEQTNIERKNEAANKDPERGTPSRSTATVPTRTPPANAGSLNPPATSPQSAEQARDSEDVRTQETAQKTGAKESKPKEGEYRDPDSVGPNPDVEAYPNQKPNEDRKFRYRPRPFGSNSHQVYPEAFVGTTPTDPDIREADDKTTEEQQKLMAKRQSSATDEHTPTTGVLNERFDRRLKEFRNAQPENQSPDKAPKYSGGESKLKENETYQVRSGQFGSRWWEKKYNSVNPTITIEGTVEKVLGAKFGERGLAGHYLVQEFNDRRNAMPKGHPIRRDDKEIYVGRVMGHRVLVHPFEVEAVEKSQEQNEKPAENAATGSPQK